MILEEGLEVNGRIPQEFLAVGDRLRRVGEEVRDVGDLEHLIDVGVGGIQKAALVEDLDEVLKACGGDFGDGGDRYGWDLVDDVDDTAGADNVLG